MRLYAWWNGWPAESIGWMLVVVSAVYLALFLRRHGCSTPGPLIDQQGMVQLIIGGRSC